MLDVHQLSFAAQTKHILKDVSFSIPDGAIVAVLGSSGAGKTTLLRCLATLEKPINESIFFNQSPLSAMKPGKIGMVFQAFHLFQHLTIIDNICLAPRCQKTADPLVIRQRGQTYLEQFGILECAQRYPHQLSGGQKQRVAIIRALMMDPSLMLFDEPTSALDPECVNDVADMIKNVQQSNRVIALVTHEIRLARKIASHILFLDHGKIIDFCAKDAFFAQETISERSKQFLSNLAQERQ
jgi:polar amino acid transport system ATP-binding protein